MMYNRKFLLNRTGQISDGVKSAIGSAEVLTLTTSALTIAPDALFVGATAAAGVLAGQPITGTNIQANTKATPNVTDGTIQLSLPISADVPSGQANTLTAPATSAVTNGSTASSGTVLNFANSNNLYVGQGVSGANIAANSRVTALNAGAVTITPATTGIVASGATITFSTLASFVTTGNATANGTSTATVPVSANGVIGVLPGAKASGTGLPTPTVVSSVDYTTGVVTLSSPGNVITAVNSGTTITLTIATSATTTAATALLGGSTLHFASTAKLTDGVNITGNNNLTAGSTVSSHTGTTAVMSSPVVSKGVIASGSNIGFTFGAVSSAALNGTVGGVFAINASQSLVQFRVAAPSGVNFNPGDLRTYANAVAADFASSTGFPFAVESAVSAGNEVSISLIATH